VEKNIKGFFEENPLAPEVIEVDGQLFLASHRGAAEECAKRIGAKVTVHQNPAGSKTAKQDAVKAEGGSTTTTSAAVKGDGKPAANVGKTGTTVGDGADGGKQ
jgi:hypothetical protein